MAEVVAWLVLAEGAGAVDADTDGVLTEPEPTAVIGVDEIRLGRRRWYRGPDTNRWERIDRWDTGFVDLAGARWLLGQAEGRRYKALPHAPGPSACATGRTNVRAAVSPDGPDKH